MFPEVVNKFWNLETVSGILILGVPLEELMYAFTFGMVWSTIYETIFKYKLIDLKN